MESLAGLDEAVSQSRSSVWTKPSAIEFLGGLMVPDEMVLRAEDPLAIKFYGQLMSGTVGFAVTSHRAVALRLGGFRSKVAQSQVLTLTAASEWDAYTTVVGGSTAWGVETACIEGQLDVLLNDQATLERIQAGLQMALTIKRWQ